MTEVLSQAEIDVLLASLASGKVSTEQAEKDTKQKVKPYDFRQPNKFSKEHMLTFRVLHESYSRLLSSFLSGFLNADINIELASVSQVTYEEFARSVVTPTLLTIFTFGDHKGNAILETNAQFITPLIDLQMGGEGELLDEIRELTDIEVVIARKIIEKMLNQLNIVWKDIFTGEHSIITMETNPHMHQLLSPTDVVLVLTFSTNVENNTGFLNLCLSYNFLEPVLHKFTKNQLSQTFAEVKPEDINAIKHWLVRSSVNISVVIGESRITVKDFLELKPGDVLTLDKKYGQDFELYIEDKLKFKVQPGKIGRRLAVQVMSLVEED